MTTQRGCRIIFEIIFQPFLTMAKSFWSKISQKIPNKQPITPLLTRFDCITAELWLQIISQLSDIFVQMSAKLFQMRSKMPLKSHGMAKV